MVVPVELLEELVAQHRLAWAKLLGEVGVAFDKTLARWSEEFPDPMRIAGETLCSDVRTRVLAMNGIDALSRFDRLPRTAPQNASCGPGSTLRMTKGPNSSVRLGDTKRVAWARLRHMTPKKAEELGVLTPQAMPVPKAGAQMALGAGEPEIEWLMGPPGMGECYEFVAYWWETPGRLSVDGGILAMVADINTPQERIIALVGLPAAIRPKTAAELEQTDTGYDEPEGDFEKEFPDDGSATGDSEA